MLSRKLTSCYRVLSHVQAAAKWTLGFIFALTLLQFSPAQAGEVVGIFGDVHGDTAIATSVLRHMKQKKVSHVIGTGDFILYGGLVQLEQILSLISPITGVPKQQIWLSPGNWEHETGYTPEEMNAVIKRFGNLNFEQYDSYGFIDIGQDRIMISHFPQHLVPEAFLPPPQYRRRIPGQAFVMNTIQRNVWPSENIAFEIFAHTHVGGAFWDSKSGKLVVNAGVLDPRAKSPSEPRAFAVYYQDQREIVFYSAETGVELARTGISSTTLKLGTCGQLLLQQINSPPQNGN